MMANNNTAIVIIGMVLIVALVMYGPVTTGFGNLLDDLWAEWGNLFGDLDGQGQYGSAGLGVTIEYADGTEKTFKSDGSSIFPLTIFDGGAEVTKIQVNVYAQISMVGTITSWSFTGTYKVTIFTKVTNIFCGTLAEESLGNPSGSTWADDEQKEFYTRDHNAGEIEAVISSRPSGNFVMKITVQMTELAFVFEDGKTESVTTMGPVTGTWEFAYSDSGISSVSLSIGTTKI